MRYKTISKFATLLLCICVSAPAHAQLANLYPHDIGIESDPNVLYVEKFDDTKAAILSRYSDVKNGAGMSLDADVPNGSLGSYSLKMTSIGGQNNGGHLYRNFTPGWDSVVYIRYYVKYPLISNGYIHHESVWLGGYNPATPWPNPQAGACGLGDSRISIAYEPINEPKMDTYLYWGDMQSWNGGASCYGNDMVNNSPTAQKLDWDQWVCVEMMVKLNNPVTASNGALRVWQNGMEVGHWGPGFPNGHWLVDSWMNNPNDPPFPGFRWRTDANLKLNYIWIEYYDDTSPANVSHYIKYDHLVIAKQYIGPLQTATGVGNPDHDSSVRVYPNPSSGVFTIEMGVFKNSTFELYNMLGKKVLQSELLSAKTDINGALSSGIYFYQVKSEGAVVGSGKIMAY